MQNADQVLTVAQTRAAEAALVARGVSVDELMQRAGRGASEWVFRLSMGGPVTVLCGPGNNGGDGYVLAEELRVRGVMVSVVAPDPPKTTAARLSRSRWRGNVAASGAVPRGAVFVDCLFGSGLSRPLTFEHQSLLASLAAQHDLAVAMDLPSGVRTGDGAVLGSLPRYDVTLALGAWKPAHFLMPAMAHSGAPRLIDIGLELVAQAAQVFPRPRLLQPEAGAYKYSRGMAGIVGGAMPGAALLAATAAMRAGAGYVKLLSAHSHPAAPAGLVVDDTPLAQALDDRRWSALLVGPGLGRDDGARERMGSVLDRGVPTILDADALHLLDDDMLEGIDASRLLATPHEGELAKLCDTFQVEAMDKPGRAAGLATATGVTILAKGPDTVLAAPDGRRAFFPPGSPWLSTAGTGDVLAGVSVSRLAAGRPPFEAAGEAVYLHCAASHAIGAAFTADELALSISNAYAEFL